MLFIGPAVFFAGSLAHPFVRDYLDATVIAAAVSAAPGQWAVSHVILAIGLGLLLLSYSAVVFKLTERDLRPNDRAK